MEKVTVTVTYVTGDGDGGSLSCEKAWKRKGMSQNGLPCFLVERASKQKDR